jgi:hypothetical protein
MSELDFKQKLDYIFKLVKKFAQIPSTHRKAGNKQRMYDFEYIGSFVLFGLIEQIHNLNNRINL